VKFLESIARLEELEEKATPKPWDNQCREFSNMDTPRHIWSEDGWLTDFYSPVNSAATDAEFVCETRNFLPSLLKFVRAVEDVVRLHKSEGHRMDEHTWEPFCEALEALEKEFLK
jgi:hypothetical protein